MNEFEQNEWDHLHDVVFEAINLSLTQAGLESIYDQLPESIKEDAVHWGLNDTVVRDNIYTFLTENDIIIE